jgi:hypothetical protein
MFRSGESEYHINGNQCRLRDIRELIMDTGIGVDGYSIIGQGKISDILSNKTESRREIFEEAAGIVLYRTKKDESEKKLAATSDNMERIQDIIGEIESRIDGLKEDSIKAEEFIGLRDRNKELEINITLKNIESLELKDEYFKDDIMELEVLIQSTDEQKEEIQKKLTELNNRNETLETIANESNQKLLVAIDELNTALERLQDGASTSINICLFILAVDKKPSKNKNSITIYITGEDKNGQRIEFPYFVSEQDILKVENIQPNASYVFNLRLNNWQGKRSKRVNTYLRVEEIPTKLTSKVFIRIKADDKTAREKLKKVNETLLSHPGYTEVNLAIQLEDNERVYISLPEKYNIYVHEELLNALYDIVGESNINFDLKPLSANLK